jgi:hypothetical protein
MTIIEELRAYAICMLDPFTSDQIKEINAFLLNEPVYADAHVPQTARNRGVNSPQPRADAHEAECVCAHTDSAILAPHILERGLQLTDIAAEYLQCDLPVAYSMNAFWTRPGTEPPRWDIQEFHRDADDARFLGLFVYLTDVLTLADGPHMLKCPDGITHTIYGPAGTAFLADTSNPHCGLKPTSHERGFAWYRWGISEQPEANKWDQIQPIDKARLGARYPVNPMLQQSIRLLAV